MTLTMTMTTVQSTPCNKALPCPKADIPALGICVWSRPGDAGPARFGFVTLLPPNPVPTVPVVTKKSVFASGPKTLEKMLSGVQFSMNEMLPVVPEKATNC